MNRAVSKGPAKLSVSVTNHCRALRIDRKLLISVVEFVGREYALTSGQVELAVFPDSQMASLAKTYLGKPTASDVLCFDLSQDQPKTGPKNAPGIHLSLALGGEVARIQARAHKTSINKELALYTVHGLLHVLGYDDAHPEHAQRMHQREDQLLREFGLGSVYHENAPDR